jgi:ribose 5-phosphate isomerase A
MTNAPTDPLTAIAEKAMALVQDGMLLGLGTGRAAEAFIRALGERVQNGLQVRCVCTSIRSQTLAESLQIPLGTLDEIPAVDIAFDGADEVTPRLDLTKGLGGALLRERVVASVAKHFVILVTPEKLVPALASRTHIPIEVVPFAKTPVANALKALGAEPQLRIKDGGPYLTDNGNIILDASFAPCEAPRQLDDAIRAIAGVVDTGFFLAMAHTVLVGRENGVEELQAPSP